MPCRPAPGGRLQAQKRGRCAPHSWGSVKGRAAPRGRRAARGAGVCGRRACWGRAQGGSAQGAQGRGGALRGAARSGGAAGLAPASFWAFRRSYVQKLKRPNVSNVQTSKPTAVRYSL
jgi:hypothetical protein